MEELVTVEQAERAVALIAVVFPSAGLLIGAVVGAARRSLRRGLVIGLACGLLGPAIWLLWRMYNGIVGAYGLDSVRGLFVNLVLFVGIGLVVGIGIGLVRRQARRGAGETASGSTE
jgi:hypothetical protein